MWPAKASAPAHLVEVAGTQVEVASVTQTVIVTRWIPHASLSLVAIAKSAVWPTLGGRPDAHTRILPGQRLDLPVNGWSAVRDVPGFVPSSLAETMWTEPEPLPDEEPFGIAPTPPVSSSAIIPTGPHDPAIVYRSLSREARRYLRYATGDVRVSADDHATIRTTMIAPTLIRALAGAQNGYLVVTVHLPFAELDGYWKPPPPKQLTVEEEAHAEISYEQSAPHSPIAAGTCLYDAPKGRIVGIIRDGDAFATPTASNVAGWYTATIPTIWGPSTYYIDTPPIQPPKRSTDEVQWKESWGNEW